ncbi:alpha/beta hydrolase [Actinokineospora iranica]|uniref:S-formylglutathione hydrolase FrmB n=1 Tax=Actinokineospora iranica TaxID=1271860 RepID=A0A1G6JHG0_9PSEU|nr:alpha/beta hydrolase-fold protein [Actinokineospora iranica]SDC17366.1 S-formylglutathione hydrolase FrmB [Actinokineospora iranica]
MNRRTLLSAATAASAVLLGVSPARATAGGRVRENLRMRSQLLGTDVLYSLYLPPGHISARGLPVLYLLHGASGDNTEWLRAGRAADILDRAIVRRRLPPMAVVMPDARPDTSKPSVNQPLGYYVNDATGSFPYADMFVKEFVPNIESAHQVGGAAPRAIGGLSMGGFGALSFAFRNPGMFAAAFAFSVGHRTDEQLVALDMAGYNWRYSRMIGANLVGADRLNERYRHWNLVDTVNRAPAADLSRAPYFLDCGAYDDLFEGNVDLHLALTRKGVPHRFLSREGAHEWSYWTSGLPAALDFLAGHLGAA